jgi:hypothetical protein
MFVITTAGFVRAKSEWKKTEKALQRSTAQALSDMAFAVRKEALDHVIPSAFVLRAVPLMRRTLLVQKAAPIAINMQQSVFYARGRQRWTALVEQETGKKTQRKHVATLAARKSKTRRIAPSGRFGRDIETGAGISGARDYHHRMIIMMQMLGRQRSKKTFLLGQRIGGAKPGLYRLVSGGKKLQLLQLLHPDRLQPKTHHWMMQARSQGLSSGRLRSIWIKAAQKSMRHLIK